MTLAGQTNQNAVSSVISSLKRVKANVIGIALNEVRKDMSDRYYYYAHYDHNVMNLVYQPMKEKRAEWAAAYKKREREFAALNPHLSPEQVRQMFADIATGFAPKDSST